MSKKIYWLQFKSQCNDELDIRINIPAGITEEQAKIIEQHYDDETHAYSEANDGDFLEFNTKETIENILDEMGIKWAYAPVDYTVYI